MPVRRDYTFEYGGFNLERSSRYLLSIIFADKPLKELYSRYDLPHLELVEEDKESEVIRLTVEIATLYRLMEWNSKEKDKRFIVEMVGALTPDIRKENVIDLTMREACNKIIHAEKFAIDVQKLAKQPYYYFKPYFHLRGTKGRYTWEAKIDVLLFCNAANQPIDDLPF